MLLRGPSNCKSWFGLVCALFVALVCGTAFSVSVPNVSLELQLEREGVTEETFGASVAISGDAAVVGAPRRNSNTGTAYVYRWNGAKWTREAELVRTNPNPIDNFGTAVSIDGDTIAVGATGSNVPQSDSGGVFVFVRAGGVWQQQAELHGSQSGSSAQFGTAVSVLGDRLVVGAPNEFSPGRRSGVAYVFERSGDTWNERTRLIPTDRWDDFKIGETVAQVEGEVLVGAPRYRSGPPEATGAVYTFLAQGGGWVEGTTLKAPDAVQYDEFGRGLAVSGGRVVVGAPFHQSLAYQAGAAYTFVRSGGSWAYHSKIVPPDGESLQHFGAAIALRGDELLVASPYLSGSSQSGFVHQFEWSEDAWVQRFRLLPADGAGGDRFGCAVAIGADRALIGARLHTVAGQGSAGTAYLRSLTPPAPTGVTATALSTSRIRVDWEDETGREEGFEIYRRVGAAGTYALVGAVGANVTEYTDEGLPAETTYTYRVRAFNTGSNSAYSAAASATTLPSTPAAPSTLTADGISTSEIRLEWTDNSTNEAQFRLERSADGRTFSPLATLGANTTTYTDDELGAGSAFHYRVRAENAGGFSPYSNTAQASVIPSAPAAPTGLQAEVQSSKAIQLSWTDASDNESGFQVERSDDEGDTYSQITKVGTGTTQYRYGSLLPATVYLFRVRAFNAGGASEYSDPVEAATLPEKPSAPTALTATALGSTSVRLQWADTSGVETAYRVERRGSGAFQEIAFLDADTIAYQDDAALPATTYTYRVRAWNEGGYSAYSNEAEATTAAGPPTAPTGLAASVVSASRIDLTWSDTSNNETGFRVERRLPSQSFQGIADLPAGTTSYASEGLAAGTTYQYRVRAFSAAGLSAPTDEVSATTLPAAPQAPLGLTVTLVGATEARLNWQDGSTNESAFKLERKKGAEPFTLRATLGANTTAYQDGGLQPASMYVYRLRAINTGGESANSEEASIVTPFPVPTPPVDLAASAVSSSQINLTWTDASTNEFGFWVERRTAGSAYTLRAEKPAGASSHADQDLAPGTTYYYRVRAFNTGGQSEPSDEVSATTLFTPPVAPTNLVVEVVSSGVLRLEWQDRSDNETGFRIFRAVNGGGMSTLTTVGPNVAFYRDGGLAPMTTCTYRVQAYNASGDSAATNLAEATTLPQPPAPPLALRATALSASEIRLDWTDNSNNETGFRLERAVGSGTFAQLVTLGANTSTYRDAGLEAGTLYTYRLRAVNAGGESSNTAEINATTRVLPPSPPTELRVTGVASQSVDLAWNSQIDNQALIDLERRRTDGSFVRIAQFNFTHFTYRDNDVQPGTAYVYRMRSGNGGGFSGYTSEVTATTLPLAPDAPSGLTVTPLSSTALRLEWQDNSDSETAFRIERATGAGFEPLALVGTNVATYRDAGLAADQSYRYRVRAVNAGGESAPSAEAEGRTLPLPPSAPTGLTALVLSSRSVRLTWLDTSGNETGFQVERKVGAAAGSGSFLAVATLAAGGTEFVDTGLAPATVYAYRVRAVNAGGGSTYAGPVEATTYPEAPSAPEDLEVRTISRTALRLTWVDTSTSESGFELQHQGTDGVWGTLTTLPANSTTHDHTGLQAGSTHSYRVRAVNASGASAYSGPATATTYALDPPTTLVATKANATAIKLTWADSTQGEAGFAVERRTASTGFVEVKRVRAGAKTYSDARLVRGATYTYRVRAFLANGGVSAYSNEASVLLPAAITRKGKR